MKYFQIMKRKSKTVAFSTPILCMSIEMFNWNKWCSCHSPLIFNCHYHWLISGHLFMRQDWSQISRPACPDIFTFTVFLHACCCVACIINVSDIEILFIFWMSMSNPSQPWSSLNHILTQIKHPCQPSKLMTIFRVRGSAACGVWVGEKYFNANKKLLSEYG